MGNRVLIYRRGGLGDTLLTFPVAEIFKRLGYGVHFAGNTDYLSLGEEAGFIDRSFSDIPPLDGYEKIVLISVKPLVEDPRTVWIKPFPPKREHITSYYLRSLKLEGFPFSEILPIEGFPDWEGRIILHPGSGSPKKNAPLELFKEVYLHLVEKGEKPLFVLGEAERYLSEELKDFEIYPVEGIKTFAKLLKGAKGFLGNDSGFTHLAGYLEVKTVALFGPTDPLVWRPLGPKVEVLYKSLPCSPCFPADCTVFPPKGCLIFPPELIVEKLLF